MPTSISLVKRQLDVKLMDIGILRIKIDLVANLTVKWQSLQTATSQFLPLCKNLPCL
jgi:hypothetical protein